jgi:cytochrome P450
MPGKIAIINFQRSLAAKAAQVLRGERKVETNQDTIYDRLINEAVPREERTLGRIHDESSLVLAAGTETTGRILTVAMYYLSKDQSILRKLRAELKTVLPSPTSSVTWVQLEQLPYLVRQILLLFHFSFFSPSLTLT